jgi:pyridoxamine 5'-phosphate oxidase family protein
MSVFSDAELRYLGSRRLGRFATLGEDGYPHVVPVAFRYNPEVGAIDIGGQQSLEFEQFRDVRRTGVAALVVDDALPSGRPRAVEVCGDAVTLDAAGKATREDLDDPIIRISPRRVVSWGLELDEPQAGKRPLLRRFVDFFDDLRVWVVLATGLLAWLVSFLLATRVFHNWDMRTYEVALTAWACAGGAYVLLTLWRFLPVKPEELRNRLELMDRNEVLSGQVMGLWTMVIFVAAVLFTVVGLQSNLRDGYTLVAAIAAVIASWLAIHALYAEYYAYQYYGTDAGGAFYFPDDNDQKGAHGYLDFAYFSLAIASTFGTTDVRIFGHVVRRSVLVHEVLSFWFNVGIIAAVFALATS